MHHYLCQVITYGAFLLSQLSYATNAAESATSVNAGAFCSIMIIALQYSLFYMKLNFHPHWK